MRSFLYNFSEYLSENPSRYIHICPYLYLYLCISVSMYTWWIEAGTGAQSAQYFAAGWVYIRNKIFVDKWMGLYSGEGVKTGGGGSKVGFYGIWKRIRHHNTTTWLQTTQPRVSKIADRLSGGFLASFLAVIFSLSTFLKAHLNVSRLLFDFLRRERDL